MKTISKWKNGGSAISKINKLFLCLVLGTIIFSLYNYMMYQDVGKRYEESVQSYYRVISIKEKIQICDQSINGYLQSKHRGSLVEHNRNIFLLEEDIEALKKEAASPRVRSMLQSMSDAFYSYQTCCNYAAFFLAEHEPYKSGVNLHEAKMISRYMNVYCDDLLVQILEGNRVYYENLKEHQSAILALNIFVLFLLGLMAFLGIRYLNDTIKKPLLRMYCASLSIAKGDFAVFVDESCEDTMMRAQAQAFNKMSQNIVQTVDAVQKNAEYERLLEQANFLALQSQANPHFLFNTLNAISRTVTLGMNDTAVDMIDAMASLLRYNLQDASPAAKLSEELNVVKRYLDIQQYRFSERITAKFEYDEEMVKKVLIPRFSLQPIVENAVIHGIEPKTTKGTLVISVTRDGNSCKITIHDDGVGISRKQLDEMLKDGSGKGHTSSIGIANTMGRLKIFTRDENAFMLESTLNKGTTATIRIPLEESMLCTNY